jgi:hemolysin activation/secretion protein
MNLPLLRRGCLTLAITCAIMLAAASACLAAPAQEFVLQEITASSIVVDNNRIIPADALHAMTDPYLNRRISYMDLELLRNKLTMWLIDHGYINSGIVIPDQEVAGGVVHLTLVEGRLTSVTIEGNRHFSKDYLIGRISRHIGPPFRVSDLQEAFQLLYQDQRITAINADLSGGLAPGDANLTVRVTEVSPWQISLNATNDNPPSIGSYRGGLLLAHRNLTGTGDTLEGSFGGSEGGYDYGARYSRPLSYADTMLDLYFRRSDFSVIDPVFKPLDITSSSGTYGIRISHPLVRSVRHEIRPSLSWEYRESKNFLLGEGFSFSPHEKDGESRFSAARIGLEWVERRDGSVFVASSIVSGGVTDESFVTWLGRLLWMQRTGLLGSRVQLRGEAQVADISLAPLEKYAMGGLYTVRGYRKNVLVSDNAVTGSLEWWFPLVQDGAGTEYLSLAPFADYGRGWDNGASSASPRDLASVGIGLRLAWKGLAADFFYGYALRKSGERNIGDPQEDGIHFAVTWNVL